MSTVRVRFAPSPTGRLHVGNIRTALFNYLFARHGQGKLVLRIEDTDRERSKQEFNEAIAHDLKVLGIDYDEGPFYQSKRLSIYNDCLKRLKEQSQAYLCYCTQDELAARRREALAMKRAPRYDNRCRKLSDAEQKKKEASGVRPTVRFKVEVTEPIIVHDLIRGDVSFDPKEIGDFVIMRADPDKPGDFIPTFHMSVCVDDGLMNITHVIRGEDHLSNSPRHALLFQALGFKVPQFAHLSLVNGPGGESLSKRYGSVSVTDFVEQQGYLPEALRNYLALLGWSPKDNREVFTPSELIEAFQIKNSTRHAAIFTEQKLKWINSEHLKKMSEADFLKRAFDYLKRHDVQVENEAAMKQVLIGLKADIHRFDELIDVLAFLDETVFAKRLKQGVSQGPGSELHDVLAGGTQVTEAAEKIVTDLTDDGEDLYRELTKSLGKIVSEKGKKLYMPIRAAITGETHGMELKRVFQLLDRRAILKRINAARKLIASK
jgi:nondiscriminating glutamyl-tRNA synthetase